MMCHSAATQKLIYAGPVEGFRAMESLRGMEPKEEVLNLCMKLYFDSYIAAAAEVTTIGRCRVFVGDHNSTKTAKTK